MKTVYLYLGRSEPSSTPEHKLMGSKIMNFRNKKSKNLQYAYKMITIVFRQSENI